MGTVVTFLAILGISRLGIPVFRLLGLAVVMVALWQAHTGT